MDYKFVRKEEKIPEVWSVYCGLLKIDEVDISVVQAYHIGYKPIEIFEFAEL